MSSPVVAPASRAYHRLMDWQASGLLSFTFLQCTG